jgi:hypothetical protein
MVFLCTYAESVVSVRQKLFDGRIIKKRGC